MAEVENKKWYVVRAVSGQESKIKDYISSEINRLGYDNHLEEILVPTALSVFFISYVLSNGELLSIKFSTSGQIF